MNNRHSADRKVPEKSPELIGSGVRKCQPPDEIFVNAKKSLPAAGFVSPAGTVPIYRCLLISEYGDF